METTAQRYMRKQAEFKKKAGLEQITSPTNSTGEAAAQQCMKNLGQASRPQPKQVVAANKGALQATRQYQERMQIVDRKSKITMTQQGPIHGVPAEPRKSPPSQVLEGSAKHLRMGIAVPGPNAEYSDVPSKVSDDKGPLLLMDSPSQEAKAAPGTPQDRVSITDLANLDKLVDPNDPLDSPEQPEPKELTHKLDYELTKEQLVKRIRDRKKRAQKQKKKQDALIKKEAGKGFIGSFVDGVCALGSPKYTNAKADSPDSSPDQGQSQEAQNQGVQDQDQEVQEQEPRPAEPQSNAPTLTEAADSLQQDFSQARNL